ncbi:MAG: hypothetical protein ACRDL3_06325 [Solirubrobacterales bacterium]
MPENRPRLRELLSRHLRDVPGIEVISERRGLDRRSGEDRRLGAGETPRERERRRLNPEPERRGKHRRADVALLKPPVALPPEASRFADEIVFVERPGTPI